MINKWRSLTHDQRSGITVGTIIVLLIAFIWFGFGQTSGVITGCFTRVETFQRAYFEEDYTYACTDYEGNPDICDGTNYWDKPASEVFTVSTANGELTSTSHPNAEFLNNLGFYTMNVPEVDYSYERTWSSNDEHYFEYYRDTHNTTHTVTMLRNNPDGTQESDHDNKTPNFYPQCMAYLEQGNSVKIKTWYGISYDVEGFTG